ncbi:MAG: SMC-Scp complex subunit ScpB [Rhodospirillales bacterium]|jgi:segregation and condensation protein B|nr:SMC-Scp complex subunit ScpB [Rhodospirillales bacterium]
MSDIDGQHLRLLEAILFATTEPLSEKALAERMPEGADIKGLLAELKETYAHRGVNLRQAGKSWAFRTAPDLGPALARERQKVRKLGRAMVESLAVIAFHQPVTRAEVEEIRGVGFNRGTLDALFEAGWIRPVGRRRTPGRPVTWGTTDVFLDHFGLESLADLPGLDELKAAGLLDKRPAIESYAVKGQMRAAGDTEGMDDVDGQAPDLFNGGDQPDEPLDPGDPDEPEEEIRASTEPAGA